MQFVKDKSIVYLVNTKHGPICKLYIVQILQRLFLDSDIYFVSFNENVTYTTPLVDQINFQKCMP